MYFEYLNDSFRFWQAEFDRWIAVFVSWSIKIGLSIDSNEYVQKKPCSVSMFLVKANAFSMFE